MSGRGTAVVVEVAWVNGLAAIRSLGRHGLRVLAVDHRPYALGLRSRYAEARLAPDPLDDEDGFIEALQAIAAETDDVLPVFPTHDEHLNAIARHADVLGERYRFPFPSWDVLERIQSKRHQLETAESIGFPIPRTLPPALGRGGARRRRGGRLPARRQAVGERRLPAQTTSASSSAARTPPSSSSAYELAAPHEPMVQEFIPGGAGGDVHARQLPRPRRRGARALLRPQAEPDPRLHGQRPRRARRVWVEEVVEQGLALLRALEFHGISQVEVMRDPRDGRYKLLEVNPRLWQWHSLAAACGVDLPWIAYRDLIGDPLPPARMHGDGKRWAITLMAGRAGHAHRAAAVRRRRLRARRPEAGARPARPPRRCAACAR